MRLQGIGCAVTADSVNNSAVHGATPMNVQFNMWQQLAWRGVSDQYLIRDCAAEQEQLP